MKHDPATDVVSDGPLASQRRHSRPHEFDFATDIADEKERADHWFSQSVLDSLTACIAVLDRTGIIAAVNKAWLAFAEHNGGPDARSFGVGANFLQAACQPEGPYAELGPDAHRGIKAVLDGVLPEFVLEYSSPCVTGPRWFELHATPLANHSTGDVVLSHRDITIRKSLEQQFRQAQKMEAVGRLAGGVAHDFNNLLTVISGYSEILLKGPLPAELMRDFVAEIRRAGERAATLTRQLLAFSRKQVLESKVVDLNALVSDSEKLLKRLIGEDVALATVLEPGLDLIIADPGQIEQVIMNLAVNARDAMPEGGAITITTANRTVEAGARHANVPPGRYVLLSVADSGCGMDEQTLAHVFEPFFTTKQPGIGTGLGLAMVHGFITQSGGHITARSKPGFGATFNIYLPAVDDPVAPPATRSSVTPIPRGNETILLVEDEESVRLLARRSLETCGYVVLEAESSDEALRIVESYPGPIHLLLSDVVMPGMGGRKLADRVVALKASVKVLFFSGYTDDAVVRHGVLASGAAFLQKPFTPSTLALKVRAVLSTTP
ncbi:MAG: response regulator [Planctomycetes bacterium]|nr:response regulator [Planctomycetota bacterium]